MTAPERPLRIFAAGSLRPAFEVLRARAQRGLRLDYANARDLAERIAGGAEADVFVSASPEHPRALHAAGLVGEPAPFAANRLVVAVPALSAARDARALAAPATRVVIEVEGIPLGDYTRELLARMDAVAGAGFAARVFANVVEQVQTVDVVASRLLAGEADAAVLYATDVADRRGRLRAIELPPEATVSTTCVACVVLGGDRAGAARGWVDGLFDGPAAEVLERAGFVALRDRTPVS